ncbi:MAG: phosphatase PAP2 family protein [Candidatus Saccharimonadales bacterium]
MHEIIILVAKYLIVVSALIALLVWIRLEDWPERWRFAIKAVLGAILALLLAKLASHLFYDPRPFVAGHFTPYFYHAADNGFVSDHTLLASFLAFTVWRYKRWAGVVLFVLAIAIGLARVVAGVHHLADIGGAMVCALIGVVLAWLIVKYWPVSSKKGIYHLHK